jgi:hypothetical protein
VGTTDERRGSKCRDATVTVSETGCCPAFAMNMKTSLKMSTSGYVLVLMVTPSSSYCR